MTDVIAGRFALCDPIARGGTGVVWRAYDRKLDRFCAAKVLRRRDAGDLLRFVREQSVRIAHPHVLTPYSWAAEDAHVVIASELADGGSVSTLIGDYGALDERSVAALLDQLLEALEHVHAAGLVHRDVKPANLLLRATGSAAPHLMLSDFGIAMGVGDAHLTEVGTVVGTPGYLAPELMHGGVAPDPRHDLYAAGRVAVALLTGEEPRDMAPHAVAAVPGPLRDLVAALAAPHPLYRPPSAAVARSALRPALGRRAAAMTAGGDPVEVLDQLPPLSDAAVAEATFPAAPATPAAPEPVPVVAPPTRLIDERTQATTAAVGEVRSSTAVLASDPRRQRGRRQQPQRRQRRPLLLGAAVATTVVAIGVPVTLAATGALSGSGTPSTSTPARPPASISRSATSPSGSPATASVVSVRLGDTCTWQQQGDRAQTADGTSAVCRSSGNSYVWVKAT